MKGMTTKKKNVSCFFFDWIVKNYLIRQIAMSIIITGKQSNIVFKEDYDDCLVIFRRFDP